MSTVASLARVREALVAKILHHPCPECGANNGEPCTAYVAVFHLVRVTSARKAWRAAKGRLAMDAMRVHQ